MAMAMPDRWPALPQLGLTGYQASLGYDFSNSIGRSAAAGSG